jgi:DNA polymerase I-like protein with 3'-5' exonuclease and polymerase domains
MTRGFSIKSIQERRAVAEAVVVPMLKGVRDRKVAGTYKRMTPGKDGRIRTVLAPDTASFRMSSSDSLLFPSTNLQNVEKKVAKLDPEYKVRDIFVADEGMELVACDYVGAEAIGCAAYSQDWSYLDKLLAGADTHSELACILFELQTCTPLQRDIAKTIRYASQYNAKVRTITLNLNKEADTTGMYFGEEQVTAMHHKLLQLHPLERWWEETRRELEKQQGVLTNCFGYRRTFHNPDADERLKEGLSFYPQSTVAWLMNRSLPTIFRQTHGDTHHLLLQIHDELLFQCVPDAIPFLTRTVTPLLEQPFTIHGRELYIPIEWKRGMSWGGMTVFKHKEL